ncbi:uncharacterized protein LOC123555589 [Mercenaria mercenaria]|uniref:uncharacterized protein LOC123555589 n=1 Tax=Mercenaria mercenaria TaxID=6596 RepID=UPI001E1D86D4|nr:uncharacterized protein LOC123555589 [Mercenaria mercenaria]
MADCCKAEQKTGKAVISCFVKHNRSIYAIVCRHVTNTARDSFFVKEIKTPFARKMRKNMKNEPDNYTDNDIDLIEITTDRCNPVFRNLKGEIKCERIFTGRTVELYGKAVFQCYKTDTEGTCNSKAGTISPLPKISEIIQGSYSMETHFVVGEDKFADAGDSGRIVAYEANDGYLELVGIIVHKCDKQTVCLLLGNGIEYLKQQYGLELTLYKSQHHSCDDEVKVEPGQIMTFRI